MMKAKNPEQREDGTWYHSNNVIGLQIAAFAAGIGCGFGIGVILAVTFS